MRTLAAGFAGLVVGALATLALPAPAGPPVEIPSPRPPMFQKADVHTMLAWTPSSLPDGFADTVRSIDGVDTVVEVRSGTVWTAAQVPLEVATADPQTYLSFVPPAHRPAFASLGRSGAVLSESGARLRGLERGGVLEVGGMSLEVLDVVPDEFLGAHEAMVGTRDGEMLGVTRARYVLVAPEPDVAPSEVDAAIRGAVPPGTRVRVRLPGETPWFRHGDAVLPPVRLKELFGEFTAVPGPDGSLAIDPAWVGEHIVNEDVPILGAVRCHRAVLPQMRAAFAEIARRGWGDLVDPEQYGGCFSPRMLAHDPAGGLSHHAWGMAFDLNVPENAFGSEGRLDPRVVDVLERWGFTWGGRWLVPDPMHFEFLRFPTSPKG